ncbi:MAG TPA: hypothetical protein VFJ70_03675 [Burkholderiales bacterium]|nr:hypothetical protein [Burkholderiales bacterium]
MALALSCTAHAQWAPQYEAGYLYDTNLSRAQTSEDQIKDSALVARAALARAFPIADYADASVGLDARLTRYTKSHGASFVALGGSAGVRRKLGLGLTAPWIALEGTASYEDAREDIRDGTRYLLSATVGKRFTPELDASAGYAYDRRVQREEYAEDAVPGYSGKPFSLQGRSWFARVNYALGERAGLIGAAALRHGDVVSSTRRNFAIFTGSNAIAEDPAFGPDFIAYRLSGASTSTFTGGISWSLASRTALEATLTKDDTTVAGGLDYRAVIFSLTLIHRQ